jgi:hypothetical protein
MSDLRDRYLACWNETDPQSLAALVASSWAPDGSYVDPLEEVIGRESVVASIAAVHERFPGFVFTPIGDVDEHHNVARFQWGFGPEGGEPLVVGFDVVITNEAALISIVIGFFDRVPEGTALPER